MKREISLACCRVDHGQLSSIKIASVVSSSFGTIQNASDEFQLASLAGFPLNCEKLSRIVLASLHHLFSDCQYSSTMHVVHRSRYLPSALFMPWDQLEDIDLTCKVSRRVYIKTFQHITDTTIYCHMRWELYPNLANSRLCYFISIICLSRFIIAEVRLWCILRGNFEKIDYAASSKSLL